jgi:hypothetical protein
MNVQFATRAYFAGYMKQAETEEKGSEKNVSKKAEKAEGKKHEKKEAPKQEAKEHGKAKEPAVTANVGSKKFDISKKVQAVDKIQGSVAGSTAATAKASMFQRPVAELKMLKTLWPALNWQDRMQLVGAVVGSHAPELAAGAAGVGAGVLGAKMLSKKD